MIAKSSLWSDPGAIEILLGAYSVGSASRLLDPMILAKAQEYRRLASARMQPIEPKEIAARMPNADYHVSRKVDGEFTMLVWRDGHLLTLNPGGTVRMGLPWQEEAIRLLEKSGIEEAMIAGELYALPPDGRRPRVHDIISMARQPRDQGELNQIRFAVFDIVSLNGKPLPPVFSETWKQIEKIFSKGDRIHPVESKFVKDPHEIMDFVEKWIVGESAEGIVARSDNAGTFKIKPRHNLDLAVIGFTESTGDRQGMLHDLLLAARRQDGTLHVVSRVGGGFTDDDRRAMLSDLKDMAVESQYAEVNSDHVAYQMVSPDWVVEISCLDVISQTTRGAPIQRMVLQCDSSTQSMYEVIRPLPLATLISPQFIRKRDDKTTSIHDVRIDQLSARVEIPMVDQNALQMSRPKGKLLSREVFIKEAKGQLMVRKFVMWETNKAEQGDDFLAFGLHFTDFSPNRKTPLEREVRVSNSIDQIRSLYESMKVENVKAGWKAVESPSSGESKVEPVSKLDVKDNVAVKEEVKIEETSEVPKKEAKKASPKRGKAKVEEAAVEEVVAAEVEAPSAAAAEEPKKKATKRKKKEE